MRAPVEHAADATTERLHDEGARRWRAFVGPTVVAIVAAAAVLAVVVGASGSAWTLLGAGRGVVPDEYASLWAFVLVFATTLGQALGWAGGSGIVYYVMTRIGFAAGASTARLAMSAVYLGLGALPLLVFHVTFGRPLLGLPREGVAPRLATEYPDAYRLLVTLHPLIDLSVIPLAAVFFGFLWLPPPQRSALASYGVALSVIATALAVALSLTIHATLVHLRF